MKKLITEKTIAQLKADNTKFFPIDENTLITPSAKDAARNEGITFVYGEQKHEETQGTQKSQKSCDKQAIVDAVIKVLRERGLLDEIID
jgi:ethanolamine utilization protein EutQ